MYSARTILSPTKQNQIPSGSPNKQFEKGTVNQILNYLKSQNIKLPSHILSKNPEEFNIKLHPVQENKTNQNNQIKILKIKLNDTEFELKKLEEDFAQYKRTVKLDKEKQHKKWQQNLQKLKQNSKQNHQDYDYSLKKLNEKHLTQIHQLKSQNQFKIQKLDRDIHEKHQKQIKNIRDKFKSQIELLQKQKDKQYHIRQKQLNDEINRIKQQYEKQKHQLHIRYKQKLEVKEKNYQSMYTALQSEKRTEEKLHEKTKTQTQKQKDKLYSQLCYERNVKKNLQETITQKNKQIKQLNNIIEDLKIQLSITQDNAKNEKKFIIQENERQIQKINKKYEQKLTELLENQIQQCTKYDAKISKMQVIYDEVQRIHEAKLEKLAEKFEQRDSKKQDLEEIRKLTQNIVKRDQEIKKLTRELRYRNLQIQNKQEVYNKIFKSSTKMRQDKRMLVSVNKQEYPPPKLQRDAWSKESLVRKSQTQDVKVFLASMNKTRREKINNQIEDF